MRVTHVVRAVVHWTNFQIPDGSGFWDQNSAAFWDAADCAQTILAEVDLLAAHLKGRRSELLAYDIISEPTYLMPGKPAAQPPNWPEIQQQIADRLRARDANPQRWIVVKPGPWGGVTGYDDFELPAGPRLIASVHFYAPHSFTHQGMKSLPQPVTYPGVIGRTQWDSSEMERALVSVRNWQLDHLGIPIFVGEHSAANWAPGADQWLSDFASFAKSYGWAISYFSLGGYTGWEMRCGTDYPHPQFIGYDSPRARLVIRLLGDFDA